MLTAALASTLHMLGLALSFAAVFARGRGFRALRDAAPGAQTQEAFARTERADNAWGVSAILIMGSGLWRLFGELDKGLSFYTYNGFFWTKMSLVAAVLLLELWPMVTLIRWRIARARGRGFDTTPARWFVRTNDAQLMALVALVTVAPMMARALWLLEVD